MSGAKRGDDWRAQLSAEDRAKVSNLEQKVVHLRDAAGKNAKRRRSKDGKQAGEDQAQSAAERDRARMAEEGGTPLQRLVEIGRAEVLWHDRDGVGYASICRNGHFEHHRIKSRSFRTWLRQAYRQKHQSKIKDKWIPQQPNGASLKEAVEALDGYASDSDVQREASFRVWCEAGVLFLDLGQPDWRATRVTREDITLVPVPAGMYRPSGQHPLPVPKTGPEDVRRGLETLRRLVNVADEDFVLLVGFMLEALGSGPYPILLEWRRRLREVDAMQTDQALDRSGRYGFARPTEIGRGFGGRHPAQLDS
jgi:hypothetical protein